MWDEGRGQVSRSFDEWRLVDRDQRAFLRLGLHFAAVEYARHWKEAGEEPYWDGGPEHVDSFELRVDLLWENDYTWMHLAGVLRDSVSNFEVYLEKAREQVVAHHGLVLPIADRAPKWWVLDRFFKQLGIKIETADVKEVLELRNFLTHRRGELRTEDLREAFQATHSDLIPPWMVELTRERILDAMDKLATAVRAIDPVVYEHSWDGKLQSHLKP